ncbi:hypothetical protein AKO1_001220 [Acrasis kona]|uniref:PATROL1-like C-terminal domain-containing protein n=1 Tax=Acrasis kona TaxID=1008807 RepID=A0AAW2ZC57_9EUKA
MTQTVKHDIDDDDDETTTTTSLQTETFKTSTVFHKNSKSPLTDEEMYVPDIDFDNLVNGTTNIMMNLISDLCDYIGTRNIYIELHDPLFIDLYCPFVENTPFAPMLPRYFDPCLSSCCELAPDAYCVDLIIKSMFRKFVRALYSIILDGGRIFFPHDSLLLLKDIEAAEQFFYGEDQDKKKIEYMLQYTIKLKSIIAVVMDKSAKELIEGGNYNQPYFKLPDKVPDVAGSPWTKQIVWKVLSGRVKHDSVAKKFIKNNPNVFD